MTLEEIRSIEFHDQSLDAFEFDFLNKKIKFVLSLYNEISNDYDGFSILFEGVSDLKFDDFVVSDLRDLTIAELNLESVERSHFCQALFLEDLSGDAFNLRFSFDKIKGVYLGGSVPAAHST